MSSLGNWPDPLDDDDEGYWDDEGVDDEDYEDDPDDAEWEKLGNRPFMDLPDDDDDEEALSPFDSGYYYNPDEP